MFCILMQVDKKLFENFFGWECSSYGGFRTLKLIDFLHAGTNLCKLKHDWKFLDGYVQKLVWPVWPEDSKIDCISEMSRWNKLIFSSLYKFRNVDSMISGWKWSKMAIKICYIWRMNVLIELIFWMLKVMQCFLVRLISYSFPFKYWGSAAVVLVCLFLPLVN